MTTASATARIEVFRPGTFKSMEGIELTYTAADLKAMADGYDYETAPAPVVVGHPSTDAPAFAWAESFDFDATTNRLYATVSEINPAFAEEVKKGNFREDLYYRLNVFRIEVPALAERKQDIPLLVAHFLKHFSEENGREMPDRKSVV